MTLVRRLLIVFTAVFLIGFYFGPQVAATLLNPGSEEDPLVTKMWVDGYIYEKFATVHNQAAALEQKVQALKVSVEQIKDKLRPIIILSIGSKTGLVGSEEKNLDVSPVLVSGRVLVPLRFVGEAFGVNFVWDKQSKTVSYQSGSGEVILIIGEKTAQVGGQSVTLDVPGKLADGRTLVPLRFIGESLGADVIWHGDTKSVEIR